MNQNQDTVNKLRDFDKVLSWTNGDVNIIELRKMVKGILGTC